MLNVAVGVRWAIILVAQKKLTLETLGDVQEHQKKLLAAIRVDLGIPKGAIEVPTSNTPAS